MRFPLPITWTLSPRRKGRTELVWRRACATVGLSAGQAVTVAPDDYGIVPVAGELLRLTIDDVAIRRVDPLAGEVVVRFPRIGYRVKAA